MSEDVAPISSTDWMSSPTALGYPVYAPVRPGSLPPTPPGQTINWSPNATSLFAPLPPPSYWSIGRSTTSSSSQTPSPATPTGANTASDTTRVTSRPTPTTQLNVATVTPPRRTFSFNLHGHQATLGSQGSQGVGTGQTHDPSNVRFHFTFTPPNSSAGGTVAGAEPSQANASSQRSNSQPRPARRAEREASDSTDTARARGASAPVRTDAAKKIAELVKENEKSEASDTKFSRSCGVCLCEKPARRAVFTECGHALCLACAEQLKKRSEDEETRLNCPLCRKRGGFVPLFEEQIDN